MRTDISFRSEGAELHGWLYNPETAPPWPVVVMAHGFSATRRMVADDYAAVFREAGLAVLLYDHRGFAESGGEPRRQVNPWTQARGYRDAINYVGSVDGLDSNRVAIWGDSISGSEVLAVAAVDHRVAALVAQVPAIGREMPPDDRDGLLFEAFRQTLLQGDIDPSPGEILGPMPVVSDDQARRPSALQPLTAYSWFIQYGCRFGMQWENDVTRVSLRSAPWQPSLCAPYVTCPTLFVVSPADEMLGANPAVAQHAYERLAGPKERLEIDGGHFGLLYAPSPMFDLAVRVEAEFLVRQLNPFGSGKSESASDCEPAPTGNATS